MTVLDRLPSKWLLGGLTVLFAFMPLPVRAQDPGSSASPPPTQQGTDTQTSNNKEQNKDQNQTQNNDSSSPPLAPAQILDTTPVVRQIGSAAPLNPTASPLRWGPLYVASAGAMFAYDNLQGSGSTVSSSAPIGIFQTTLVLDKQTEQNRFAVQYSPSVAITSGNVYSNFTSQGVSFNSAKSLTPRLNVSFSDNFSYIRTENLLVDSYFSVDTISNSVLQGQFLNNSGRSIRDSAQVSVGYMLSPQMQLSVSGSYDYADTTNFETSSTANEYGTTITLSRALSHRDTLGITYGFQLAHITDQDNVYFHSFGFTYTRMLTESFSIGGSGSASAVVPGSASQGPGRWTWAASAQALKTFNRSSLAATYSRTQGIAQFITTQFYDRGDIGYDMRWNSRWSSSAGIGYYRTVADSLSTQQHSQATYVRANTQYLITPTVAMTLTFAHQVQSGDATQILTGTNDLIFIGLRWVPGYTH